MTSLSREPSAKTARSKSRSRSRSPKVKSLMLSEQAPSPKFVTTRSSSVPAQMDTAKLLTPKKIAIKENPRHVCEAKYSPNVNNVIIFRRHPVSKDFWNNYPVEKHPVLIEHTGSTVIFCCSVCNDFLPKTNLQMWQNIDRRWSNHAAHCHKSCDFFVSPMGKMYMKHPFNNSQWWPLNPGHTHYDETLHVIKELSKSLPPFCLPPLDGNIFTLTAKDLIGCTRCDYCYPKQAKGNCNGWALQFQAHYQEAHPCTVLPSKKDIATMWDEAIVFQKGRTYTPS